MVFTGGATLIALGGLVAFDSVAPIVPSEAAIFASASQATAGSLVAVAIVVAAGGLIGDIAMHLAGRQLGASRFGRWIERRRWPSATRQPHRVGPGMIVIGRFVPVGRSAVAVASGYAKLPLRRYLPASMLGVVLWTAYVIGLGRVGSMFTDNFWLQLGISLAVATAIGLAVAVASRLRNRRGSRPDTPHRWTTPRPSTRACGSSSTWRWPATRRLSSRSTTPTPRCCSARGLSQAHSGATNRQHVAGSRH